MPLPAPGRTPPSGINSIRKTHPAPAHVCEGDRGQPQSKGRMIVVIAGTLADVCAASRELATTQLWALWPHGRCVTALLFSVGHGEKPNAWLRP